MRKLLIRFLKWWTLRLEMGHKVIGHETVYPDDHTNDSKVLEFEKEPIYDKESGGIEIEIEDNRYIMINVKSFRRAARWARRR